MCDGFASFLQEEFSSTLMSHFSALPCLKSSGSLVDKFMNAATNNQQATNTQLYFNYVFADN